MDEQTHTLLILHKWQVVLLGSRSKKPIGKTWQVTRDLPRISHHIAAGGNIGLHCCQESGVAVLDFDDLSAASEMLEALGPLPVTVFTGSDKWHTYIKWEPGLPAKIKWREEIVGEIQRGPNQQVVMPPSIHPNGRPYVWNDAEVIELPQDWREHLTTPEILIPRGLEQYAGEGLEHLEREEWDGPPPEEILRRAAMQPGAKHRATGIKFQCPACRDLRGRDRHRDNAFVRLDGRWGCAYAPGDSEHKRMIGEALGIFSNSVTKEVLGDHDELKDVSLEDLD